MEFLRQADIPRVPPDRLFRQSQLAILVTLMVFGAIAGGVSALIVYQVLHPFFWVSVVVLGLVELLVVTVARATFRSTNWIVQIRDGRLWVNLRSYHNWHFADDEPSIVVFSFSEIASAGRRERIVERPMDDSKVKVRNVQLVLKLRGVDGQQLERAIVDERNRRPPEGMITSRSKHFPVTLHENDELRIAWYGRADRVTPKVEVLLDVISSYVTIAPPDVVDETRDDSGEKMSMDAKVLELCQAGDTLGACAVLTSQGGYTTTEAKQFVDDLMQSK